MTLSQAHRKAELEVSGYLPTREPKKSYLIGCCIKKIHEEWLVMVEPITNHYIVITLNGTVRDFRFI